MSGCQSTGNVGWLLHLTQWAVNFKSKTVKTDSRQHTVDGVYHPFLYAGFSNMQHMSNPSALTHHSNRSENPPQLFLIFYYFV